MASHKGWDRHFVTIEGLTMKSGRSLNLAKGQFGVVDMESTPTNRGNQVISSFGALSPKNKLELRLGLAPLGVTRSQSNKALSSKAFKISDVIGLRVDAPKQKGIPVDEFRLGYNGIEDSSAIVLENGDNEVIEINMCGKALGLLGATGGEYTVKLYIEAPNEGAFTNQEVIENAVDRFNKITLLGGVPITNYVEATPVNSEAVALTGADYTFFKLRVKDNGDATSLALVQAQYPNNEVKLESNEGGYSTYVILAPAATVLANYTYSAVSLVPGCDCPDGFTLTDGLCVSDTVPASIAWTAGDTCKASSHVYTIILADDECGTNKLAALQAAYPDLVITVAGSPTANSSRALTLTGTSGTANINVAGTNYLATFATNLATTASNFVTAHAANILAASGTTVTANAGVLTFVHASSGFPTITITNATTDLAGTLGAVAVVNTPSTGGCMTSYSTTVVTDVVCEECSPILNQLFTSEAPEPYENVSWKKAPKVYSATAKMGINFKSKAQIFAGDETYRDSTPFIASPVRLRVTGGEPTVSESFTVGRKNRMAVKIISVAQEPESFGGDLYDWEDRGNVFFTGRSRFEDNNFGNWALGQESHLKPTAQYVDYVLTVRINSYAQSFSGELNETFNFHIIAEVGKHQDIEDILNDLATAAGIDTVVAYS